MNQKWPDYEVTQISIEGWKARIFADEEVSLGKITLIKTILVEKERLNEKKSPEIEIVVNETFDLYFTIENVTLTLNPNNAFVYDLQQLGYTEKQTTSNLEPEQNLMQLIFFFDGSDFIQQQDEIVIQLQNEVILKFCLYVCLLAFIFGGFIVFRLYRVADLMTHQIIRLYENLEQITADIKKGTKTSSGKQAATALSFKKSNKELNDL